MKCSIMPYMRWLGLVGLVTVIAAPVACSTPGDKLSYAAPADTSTTDQVAPPTDDEEEAICPHEGPILDVSSFVPCPQCGGGHCLLNSLLPPDKLGNFDDCDAESKCVPDLILETKGMFIPQTCRSVLGSEGRCVSRCLGSVEEKADSLPQDICTDDELCVPCFDPFTKEPTGACQQSCDPGPTEEPADVPTCCGGDGLCLPEGDVGDKGDQLAEDVCPQNNGPALCVPAAFLEPGFKPASCWDDQLFSGPQPGACLPECLPAVQGLLQDFILDQEGCPSAHRCAPCDHPITGEPTGACDL